MNAKRVLYQTNQTQSSFKYLLLINITNSSQLGVTIIVKHAFVAKYYFLNMHNWHIRFLVCNIFTCLYVRYITKTQICLHNPNDPQHHLTMRS